MRFFRMFLCTRPKQNRKRWHGSRRKKDIKAEHVGLDFRRAISVGCRAHRAVGGTGQTHRFYETSFMAQSWGGVCVGGGGCRPRQVS